MTLSHDSGYLTSDILVPPWLISNLMNKIPIYLYSTFIKILYMFRALAWSSFLTGAQDSHLQTVTIPEAAYIKLRRRPLEDEQGNARNM